MEELRRDNAALLKRLRASQSPVPTKRRQPIPDAENSTPSLGDKTNFLSPGEAEEAGVKAKRRRLSAVDLDASLDLFGSPGESALFSLCLSLCLCLPACVPAVLGAFERPTFELKCHEIPLSLSVLAHPGSIDTPPIARAKPTLSSASISVSTPTSSSSDGRSKPFALDDVESPSVGIAKESGVKYVKTKTDFDSISKMALGAVRMCEQPRPVYSAGVYEVIWI